MLFFFCVLFILLLILLLLPFVLVVLLPLLLVKTKPLGRGSWTHLSLFLHVRHQKNQDRDVWQATHSAGSRFLGEITGRARAL